MIMYTMIGADSGLASVHLILGLAAGLLGRPKK
jgi:hypothetical protein